MRIRIDHLTQYGYSLPVRSLIQILRLTPRSTAHQSVIDWRIEVDCDARLLPFTDAHGNLCHMRSEEHTSELQSLMRISYAVFCLKKKNNNICPHTTHNT